MTYQECLNTIREERRRRGKDATRRREVALNVLVEEELGERTLSEWEKLLAVEATGLDPRLWGHDRDTLWKIRYEAQHPAHVAEDPADRKQARRVFHAAEVLLERWWDIQAFGLPPQVSSSVRRPG